MIDLLRLIYPSTCIICGSKIPFSQNRGLCTDCNKLYEGNIFKKTVNVSYKSGNSIKTKDIFIISPFPHTDKIRKQIYAYKFSDKKPLARLFAFEMLTAFRRLQDANEFDTVTYIPLSRAELYIRGYDQSLLLAKCFAKFAGLPMKALLKKVRENEEQHTLNAEKRKTNVIGVYACNNEKNVNGKSIILCDDISTTGSTLTEGCRVLLENGAKNIVCVTATQGILSENQVGIRIL